MDLSLGLPPFVGCFMSVIVFEKNPLANFSSYFSLRFAKQLKANFPINFGEHAGTSPNPSRMLHLSHSRKTLCHSWKIAFVNKKIFMHSFVDSTFRTCLNISSNFYNTFHKHDKT
jgi:hypothetical protein